MKQIKGILFDFNGTLFFDSGFHLEAFQKIFPEYGMPKPTEKFLIEKVFGRSNPTIYRENIDPDGTDEAASEFGIKKESIYFELCLSNRERFVLVDGVAELLNYLKSEEIPFTIATGSDRTSLEFFFKHLDLGRWFDINETVYYDGSFAGKPAPDCYLLAAKKLGLSAGDCLVFEDGTSGIMSANAAGAAGVVAVYDKALQSPLREGLSVDLLRHDFKNWRGILSHYEIVR